ncbi:MAG: exo-alpha-sialidase [Anaerolineae bacterium]|nr:exo-alpha-sialidase [Anaerolineae bacterium]
MGMKTRATMCSSLARIEVGMFKSWFRMLEIAVLAAVLLAPLSAGAQSDDLVWSDPVNLSQSGAASAPVIAGGSEGSLQVFWQDRFDGLVTARYQAGTWSAPVPAPLQRVVITEEAERLVAVGTMPEMAADSNGRVHAWWLGNPNPETGYRPLWHSWIAIGETVWLAPDLVAESAVAWDMVSDEDGMLHIFYVRPAHTEQFPAGIYHKRSTDGGATWSTPSLIAASVYFRLLEEEEAYVVGAADALGNVFVVWDDAQTGFSHYAASTDGGVSWNAPERVGDDQVEARHAFIVTDRQEDAAGEVTGSQIVLLWEVVRTTTVCAVYQQTVEAAAGAPLPTWTDPIRVLDDFAVCGETYALQRTASGNPMLVSGAGGDGLSVVLWNGVQWSEPQHLLFGFFEPVTQSGIRLGSLNLTVSGDRLAVVGLGDDQEVWVLQSEPEPDSWAFAPSTPWTDPQPVLAALLPDLPVLTVDDGGTAHALWSQSAAPGETGYALFYSQPETVVGAAAEAAWTQPVALLDSPIGKAEQPDLLEAGGQLHAVWSGGFDGEILYSRAFVRDVYAADGWSIPMKLHAGIARDPQLVAGPEGQIFVAYAVPFNESRGVYLTRSGDGGQNWSESFTVFDAVAGGWVSSGHVALDVDDQGGVHVAWVRLRLPGNGLPEGVYYAYSQDEGKTWTSPVEIAAGAYDWPQVVVAGETVHVLAVRVDGESGVWQRRTVDGESWSPLDVVPGVGEVQGRAAAVADVAGGVHLVAVGAGESGDTSLVYTVWQEEQWRTVETIRLMGAHQHQGAGASADVRSDLGRLDVLFVTHTIPDGSQTPLHERTLWYARREIAAIAGIPEATTAEPVTPTVAVTAEPTSLAPTPTPRPDVNPNAVTGSMPAISLGPITVPLLALFGFAGAGVLVVVALAARFAKTSARRR